MARTQRIRSQPQDIVPAQRYTRTLSPSASVAPSKLSNRLACLQLQCHTTPHNHSSSAGSASPSEYLGQLRVVKPTSVCYVGFGGGIGKHLHNPQMCAWARAELRNRGAGGGVSPKSTVPSWQPRTWNIQYIVERWHAKQIT